MVVVCLQYNQQYCPLTAAFWKYKALIQCCLKVDFCGIGIKGRKVLLPNNCLKLWIKPKLYKILYCHTPQSLYMLIPKKYTAKISDSPSGWWGNNHLIRELGVSVLPTHKTKAAAVCLFSSTFSHCSSSCLPSPYPGLASNMLFLTGIYPL